MAAILVDDTGAAVADVDVSVNGRTEEEGLLMPVDFVQDGGSAWTVTVDGVVVSSHATERKALGRALAERLRHPSAEVFAVLESRVRPTVSWSTLRELVAPTQEPVTDPDVPEDPPEEPPTDPEPDPDPVVLSWQEAWDTDDYDTIRNWYRANTGIAAAGLTDADLTPSGSITTDHDGQVIEGLLVTGSIQIQHDNVTVRNCKIVSDGGSIGINVTWGDRDRVSTFTVDRVSLVGDGSAAQFRQAVGGTYAEVHASRVYISGFGGGFRLSHTGADTVTESMVENILIHTGSHNTGLSFRGGTGKRVVRSFVEGSTSSALSMYPDVSPVLDAAIEQNLFDGGTYSIHGGDDKTFGSETTASFVGNRFTRTYQYGPLATFDRSKPGRVWMDNRHLDGELI